MSGIEVAGSTVLVTGASSGIGAATARLLADRGATVGIVARRAEPLARVLEHCRARTPASFMVVQDLGDLDAAERVAREAWDRTGGIDVLVNNAAIPKRRHVTRLTPDEVETVMRVNYHSPVRMTLALLPRMLERGRGVVVNVSSLGGRIGIVHEAAYCASKFALCGFSESMAIDLAGSPVSVCLVNPGAFDTEIWDLPGNEDPVMEVDKARPEECAEGILAAIESGRFESYVPDMSAVVEGKTADAGGFVEAMASMAAGAAAGGGASAARS